MAASNDHVILVGSDRPARPDARLTGPADPGEQLTVTVEVRRSPSAPPLPDLAVIGAQRPRDRARTDRGPGTTSFACSNSLASTTRCRTPPIVTRWPSSSS